MNKDNKNTELDNIDKKENIWVVSLIAANVGIRSVAI